LGAGAALSCHIIHPERERLFKVLDINKIMKPPTRMNVTMSQNGRSTAKTCTIALYGVRCDHDYDEVVNNSQYVNTVEAVVRMLDSSGDVFYLQFGSWFKDGTQEGILYSEVNGKLVNFNSQMIKDGYFEQTFGDSIR
jgi:hypothetical protein